MTRWPLQEGSPVWSMRQIISRDLHYFECHVNHSKNSHRTGPCRMSCLETLITMNVALTTPRRLISLVNATFHLPSISTVWMSRWPLSEVSSYWSMPLFVSRDLHYFECHVDHSRKAHLSGQCRISSLETYITLNVALTTSRRIIGLVNAAFRL